MKFFSWLRLAGTAALLLATGCMSTRVEPAPDLDLLRAETARPALAFDLRVAVDPRLLTPGLDEQLVWHKDGEDLAEATVHFRAALEGTEGFGAITRRPAGDGLHCAFELHHATALAAGGMFFALTLGLLPDLQSLEHELTARVSAPGREPRTYSVRTSGSIFWWTPLLPVGAVQMATRRDELQQTVDALVTQMARDGWLKG